MRLLIARHGQAVSKMENPDRPLSDDGRAEVKRVAGFLAEGGISTSRILHSGKARAAETAAIYADVIGGQCDIEEVTGLKPNDNPREITQKIHAMDTDLLIAGHLPHLGRLASLLLSGDDSGAMIAVPTASVICLERGHRSDEWYLLWMIDPALLS